jgi:hypothetical protein
VCVKLSSIINSSAEITEDSCPWFFIQVNGASFEADCVSHVTLALLKIPYKQRNQLDLMKSVKYLIHKSDARLIRCCCLWEGEGSEEEDY